jgi:hypothetical protein
MKLYPIAPTDLQYVESGQFIVRFLTDFQGTGINSKTDLVFDELYQSLVTQSPIFNKALAQIKAKAESEILLQRDEHRDKKVATVRRAMMVFEYTDDAAKQTAFNHIKIIMNAYAGLEKENFEVESLGIDNLVAALRKTENLPYVKLLLMEEHVNDAEASNNVFKTTFNKRSNDSISTEVYDTRALRKNILSTYKELAEYIAVMAKRKNNDYYNGIAAALNNGREYFAGILARRQSEASKTPKDTKGEENTK